MLNENSERKSISWRRGLHRVFVVLCVVWTLVVLVGLPIKQADQAREFAQLMYRANLDNPTNIQGEKEVRERQNKELFAQASLTYIYRTQVAPELHLYLLGVILPPALLYLFVFSGHLLVRWLYRGFKAP